ncbi:hypothetical protein XENOCAPTIV_029243 [Xenoophorus captivus]|uniref:Uncharacterized protein n=1 Tax=Xenoophorus captivus TaxID=1517983 RepID=A0ABV0RT60_9TELE
MVPFWPHKSSSSIHFHSYPFCSQSPSTSPCFGWRAQVTTGFYPNTLLPPKHTLARTHKHAADSAFLCSHHLHSCCFNVTVLEMKIVPAYALHTLWYAIL